MSYIFRWKEGNIEVYPSRSDTQEEAWKWAVKNLRGASETPEQGRRNVHKYGEVIKEKP